MSPRCAYARGGDIRPPLIAHVVYRLDVGGLENGVVNLINCLPASRYRHAVVSLTEVTDFHRRIECDGVELYTLGKREGQDPGLYLRLYRLFRRLRPDVVHTRNLATLEALLPAWLAGVPARVHGEHGWDVLDPEGANRKYRMLRRAFRPLVHRYVPLSRHIESYLREAVGVPVVRISRIYNGVDARRFAPRTGARQPIGPAGFAAADSFVVGSIGRMQTIKDPLNLVEAFIRLCSDDGQCAERLRLVMVGDGPLRQTARERLEEAGCADRAWLPGSRDDIPDVLRGLDLFVLPSAAEGISNTILEAMASGLPVVATRVGGNAELVVEGVTGDLVPPGSPRDLAAAIAGYVASRERIAAEGAAARRRVEERFTLDGMVARYAAVYDGVLAARARSPELRAASPARTHPTIDRRGANVRHRGNT